MPSYDAAHYDPPAPVVQVTLRTMEKIEAAIGAISVN